MNKKNKLISIFVLMIILSVSLAIADRSDFEIKITPVKGIILEDEVGEYDLTIINNNDFDERFQNPYTSDPDWILTAEPTVDIVPAKKSVTYRLYVDPKTEVVPGQYGLTLNVKSILTDEQRKEMFLIFVKPLNPLPVEYVKSVALNVEIPLNIDPRKDVPLSIYLRNRNAREYPNLTVKVESKLINQMYSMKFSSVEERTDTFDFKLDDYTPPQNDKMTVTLYSGDEVINQVKIPIRIIEYTEIKEDKKVFEGFLKTRTVFTLTNLGNIENKETYRYQIDFFKDLFTTTTPENTYVEKDSERYLVFPKTLSPGKSMDIEVVTNYRTIFYLAILLIVTLTLYFQLRSPVVVKKEAHAHDQTQDGVSEFKVKVLVKNRSQKPVENVKIVEMIPSLATLIKETSMGTVEPSKIMRNDKTGTLVRWDINYLEPFEERIITYKLRSKLNIVGGLTLQPTKVKFEMVTGKERVTYSRKHSIKLLH